jgi:hypothetical protein
MNFPIYIEYDAETVKKAAAEELVKHESRAAATRRSFEESYRMMVMSDDLLSRFRRLFIKNVDVYVFNRLAKCKSYKAYNNEWLERQTELVELAYGIIPNVQTVYITTAQARRIGLK